jgi:hypothetical protein
MTRPKTDTNARVNEARSLEKRIDEVLKAIRKLGYGRTLDQADMAARRRALQQQYAQLSMQYLKAVSVLPTETKVLLTTDGEPGTILNGITFDPATGEWTEYEVQTARGIERWYRRDFVLMAEIEQKDQ